MIQYDCAMCDDEGEVCSGCFKPSMSCFHEDIIDDANLPPMTPCPECAKRVPPKEEKP